MTQNAVSGTIKHLFSPHFSPDDGINVRLEYRAQPDGGTRAVVIRVLREMHERWAAQLVVGATIDVLCRIRPRSWRAGNQAAMVGEIVADRLQVVDAAGSAAA